ncbi:MAG: proton-conducting transporter membrane subunit, partial [Trebonia sp.]
MNDPHFPFLTVLLLLPAGGALAVVLLGSVPRIRRAVLEWLGIGVSLATLAVAVTVAALFSTGTGSFQFVSDHPWAAAVGVRWFLGVDGISLFLVLMAAVIFPVVLAGARTRSDARSYIGWMLLLECACIGSFVSLDLILFFFFFELTLVPAYFIISGWGYARRAYAAVKFFVYTFLGSA